MLHCLQNLADAIHAIQPGGKKLPPIENLPIAKHPKANAEGKKTERPQLRRVAKGKFKVIDGFDELYRVLFEQLDF